MRAVIKIAMGITVVAIVCVLLAWMIAGSSDSSNVESDAVDVQVEELIDEQGGWPMFRGGQQLLGTSVTRLSNSLTLIWKFRTAGEIKSSPAIDDGCVYVGSSDANIYAIDLANGRQVWSYRTEDAVEAGPCVIEGFVFVGSLDNFLYALDAKTGQLKWKYKTGGQIPGAANWTRSADDKTTWILVGSYDSKLYCVDSRTGQAVWTYETDSYINGAPAVDDGKAVFGGCDAMIHVVSVSDGSTIKQIDTGSFIAASVALADGCAYVGNYDAVFIKADTVRGEIIWQYPRQQTGDSAFFSSPAVGENVVVFGGRDARLHCVDRTSGNLIWTFKSLGDIDSSPVICGDKVVVGSEDGRLYMIRLSDGEQLWSYEIGQPITSSPAVARGMVVVGSDDGYVYAFGPES